MALFYPDYILPAAECATPGFLAALGIRGLILDIDNTLTQHDSQTVEPKVLHWLGECAAAGISMVLLSNNSPQRVAPFAQQLGLPFVADAKKPSRSGYWRAQKELRLERRHIALVGDQLFTDVLGGNVFGITTIMVGPRGPEVLPTIRLKRVLEGLVLGLRAPRAR